MKREIEDPLDIGPDIPEAPKILRTSSASSRTIPESSSTNGEVIRQNGCSSSSTDKPTIRVRGNLSQRSSLEMPDMFAGPSVRRPSLVQLDLEVTQLKEEVRALQWLARRKEQEWDQILRLLKQKEERLARTERAQCLANEEAREKVQNIVKKVTEAARPLSASVNKAILIPARSLGSAFKPCAIDAGDQANQVTLQQTQRPAAGPKIVSVQSKAKTAVGPLCSKKKDLKCQRCHSKASQFVCAGCSNRWYCSRDCQVAEWEVHADDCGNE